MRPGRAHVPYWKSRTECLWGCSNPPGWAENPPTAEDAIPKWILRRYPPERTIHTWLDEEPGAPVTRRSQARGNLQVKVGSVCSPCNTGWMSVLQNDAKLWLSSMLDGRVTNLTEAAQQIIAAWVVMTVITMQEANERIVIPDEHAKAFYPRLSQRPPVVPPQITVGLAHYTGVHTGTALFIEHPAPGARGIPRDRARYLATLRIGPLACYVFGHRLPAWFRRVVDFRPAEAVLCISPSTDAVVTWPPLMEMDDAQFERTIHALRGAEWIRA